MEGWLLAIVHGLVTTVRVTVLTALGAAVFCATLAGLAYVAFRAVNLMF